MLRRAFAVAALELAASSCGSSGCRQTTRERPVVVATPAAAPLPPSSVAPPDVSSVLPPEGTPPESDWKRRLQMRDWDAAFMILRALPEDRRQEPALRLVLGVAASESGHHDDAVKALDGLEAKLPDVADEIRLARARSAAVVGPFATAAAELLATNRIEEILEAAQAYRRDKKLDEARRSCDRALILADRAKRAQERVRLLRAEIAEAAGDRATALADVRWIVKERPELGWPHLSKVVELGGTVSFDERLAVLEKSATRDRLEAIQRELDALRKAHAADGPRLTLAWGKALLQSRNFKEATAALDRASRELSGPLAVEARFHAARAMARAGAAREAATRFSNLADARPPTAWSSKAVLRLAETQALLGRHRDAARSYTRYLGAKKKQPDEGASYGRALALLGAGRGAEAKEALTLLRKRATPKQSGFLRELEGVAAEVAGERAEAVAIWLELVRTEPLTWAAWMASARLASVGHAPLPPPIEPPPAGDAMPLDVTLPPGAALLASLGLDGLAEARLAREEDALTKGLKGRENETLCAMHERLVTDRRRMQIGERAVKREALMRPPSDAERWTWRCVYPDGYADLVAEEERRHGLVPGLIHGVIRQESAFDVGALSAVGARGLMQLMPTTAERVASEAGLTVQATEVARPEVNVRLGSHYLAKLVRTYGGNAAIAAAAYNAGPHAVHVWLTARPEMALDLWVARIPFRETRTYVTSVVGNMLRYQYLAGGVQALSGPRLEMPAAPALPDDAY